MDYFINESLSKHEEQAFKILFEEFYPNLCLYSKRFINNREAREDIVQNVFLTLWKKRKEIAINSSSIGYLKTCVKNNCLNYLEHQEYELKYLNVNLEGEPAYAKSVDSLYAITELRELLKSSLKKLPADCRRVYLMSYFSKKTGPEIALEVGLSLRTVERYRSKAIKQLKEDLKDFLPLFLILLTTLLIITRR